MRTSAAAASNLVERDGADVVGEPPIVVEPEPELLRRLQEGRDAGVGLEHARNRADEELLALRQLVGRRAVAAQRADFVIDGGDRARRRSRDRRRP